MATEEEDFYDPQNDPRYLGESLEEIDAREQRRNTEIEAIERRLQELRSLNSVFEAPGWATYEALIEEQLMRAETALKQSNTLEELHRARGQVSVLERLLAMPARMKQDVGRFQAELAEATRES